MKTVQREEFIAYLRETLIPEFLDSGRIATAAHFETAVRFMQSPEQPSIEVLNDGLYWCNEWKVTTKESKRKT